MVSIGRRALSPRSAATASLLLALAIASTGCIDLCRAPLTGTIVIAEGRQIPDPQQLVSGVSDALAPFGFVGYKTAVDNTFAFSLGLRETFARERIDVVVDTKTLWINVKDYNRAGESPIARKIADAIAQTLSSRFGVTLNFKPVADCLS